MNKTFVLILFIPLFVFISLTLIDKPNSDKSDNNRKKMSIGLINNIAYDPKVQQSINAAHHLIEVTWLNNAAQGIQLLKEHKLEGMLTIDEKNPTSLVLVVLKKESLHTLAIMESFAVLQKIAEGNRANWITNIEPLYTGGLQLQTLPTWILMLILLVSFVILPAQVAEEKEKKLLLTLLQTPIHEVEWLIAKLITGMLLTITAVFLLHLFGEFGSINIVNYSAFIIVGSFCFNAFGIFLGSLCRTQASARILGVIFYLPLLLPSALADVSQKLTGIAPLLPSYQLYLPLQSILLENSNIDSLLFEWVYLLLLGMLMFFLAYCLIKKRWQM